MKPSQSEYYRQSLLPKWIKFFCYIFMAQASLIPFALLFALYYNSSLSIYIYGLGYKASSLDLISVGFMALYIFFGFSVVAIMLGKKMGNIPWDNTRFYGYNYSFGGYIKEWFLCASRTYYFYSLDYKNV